MVFWGIGAGLGWILKPFPLPPHAPLHRRGKLIFFLKRSKKKERSGIASREREQAGCHTQQVNKSQQKKILFFNFTPCASHSSFVKTERKMQILKNQNLLPDTPPPPHNTPYPTPLQNKTKTKPRRRKSSS